MLDLSVPIRTFEGVELAADEGDPLAFYVLPPPPRVAGVEGTPQLQLLRFVRDGALTGGNLQLQVELAHPASRVERARGELADALRTDEGGLSLRPLPVEAASAELIFVGREATSDGGLTGLMSRGYGRTVAQSIAPYTAAFSVGLTPDGVRLLEAALRSGGAPVGVIYRLQVEGLWPAQRVVARVDWSRVYDHFSLHAKEGGLLASSDIQRISEQLIESRVITIQAVQGLVADEAGPPPDLTPALAWVQREVVERFCEPVLPLSREPAHASLGTLGEIMGVGSSFAVKKLTQIERATAEVDLQRALVVTRTLAVQAHLADLLGSSSLDGHILDAAPDHPFFERMSLRVQTARPLAETHLEEVVLQFVYGTASDSLRLTPEAPEGKVEAWADASPDRTWSVQPKVTFAADAPLDPGEVVLLAPLTGGSRELTLDLERLLGLARLDVWSAPDPRVLFARGILTKSRPRQAPEQRDVTLTPQAPRQTAWFRDYRPEDRIDATAEYLLADNRRVKAGPLLVDTRVVRLPPPFPGFLTVQVASEGDWEGLERVVVGLQKAADLPAATFTFDGPSKMVAVNLDMPDPTQRKFRYRVARTWTSGSVEEDHWIETETPVVLVGKVCREQAGGGGGAGGTRAAGGGCRADRGRLVVHRRAEPGPRHPEGGAARKGGPLPLGGGPQGPPAPPLRLPGHGAPYFGPDPGRRRGARRPERILAIPVTRS